jgi:hypothetical protein
LRQDLRKHSRNGAPVTLRRRAREPAISRGVQIFKSHAHPQSPQSVLAIAIDYVTPSLPSRPRAGHRPVKRARRAARPPARRFPWRATHSSGCLVGGNLLSPAMAYDATVFAERSTVIFFPSCVRALSSRSLRWRVENGTKSRCLPGAVAQRQQPSSHDYSSTSEIPRHHYWGRGDLK